MCCLPCINLLCSTISLYFGHTTRQLFQGIDSGQKTRLATTVPVTLLINLKEIDNRLLVTTEAKKLDYWSQNYASNVIFCNLWRCLGWKNSRVILEACLLSTQQFSASFPSRGPTSFFSTHAIWHMDPFTLTARNMKLYPVMEPPNLLHSVIHYDRLLHTLAHDNQYWIGECLKWWTGEKPL